jgi:hypothetical protein
MISQMVRNESVRFGRHIDIEASTRSYSWNTKIGSNFLLFGLLSKGVVWKQF